MTNLDQNISDFLKTLSDNQLRVYMDHEHQANCNEIMEDYLTWKQYNVLLDLQNAKKLQGQMPSQRYSHMHDTSFNSKTMLKPQGSKNVQQYTMKMDIVVKGEVAGHIIGPGGRTVQIISRECGVYIDIEDGENCTIVHLTSPSKEQLVDVQLKLWSLLSTAGAAIVRRDFDDMAIWQQMSLEDKAQFQSQFSVSVVESNGCLSLSTFSEDLYYIATQCLTHKPAKTKKPLNALENENKTPIHSTIRIRNTIRNKNISIFSRGNDRKAIKWVKDHYNVDMEAVYHGDNVVFNLTANEESQLHKAKLDVWKGVAYEQMCNDTLYNKTVWNAWTNVWQPKEKATFMTNCQTFITEVPEIESLLIKGFTDESVANAATELRRLAKEAAQVPPLTEEQSRIVSDSDGCGEQKNKISSITINAPVVHILLSNGFVELLKEKLGVDMRVEPHKSIPCSTFVKFAAPCQSCLGQAHDYLWKKLRSQHLVYTEVRSEIGDMWSSWSRQNKRAFRDKTNCTVAGTILRSLKPDNLERAHRILEEYYNSRLDPMQMDLIVRKKRQSE